MIHLLAFFSAEGKSGRKSGTIPSQQTLFEIAVKNISHESFRDPHGNFYDIEDWEGLDFDAAGSAEISIHFLEKAAWK